ncbi:MAG: dihydroorotate oxidase [Candidatus Levybacteria bacterium]|nr:dihydroorotate oxidase [Candidatus Levybacteria bacterium]
MKNLFYDINSSYEKNFHKGPDLINLKKPNAEKLNKKNIFLGFKIHLPFGIPAGPLLNSKFMKFAFDFGFDVSTYKTVRSDDFPCHPFPNVLYVKAPHELHPDKDSRLRTVNKPSDMSKLNITNSFGVPSQKPAIWKKDVKKALSYVKKNQLLILSFMGTVRQNQTRDEFIQDFAKAAKLASQTGAKALEVNLSCPNLGNEGLVCYDLELTEKIAKAIRSKIGKKPLILKVGYYKKDEDIEKLAQIAQKYANAIAAINTLQTEVFDKNGNQALPGKNRLKSGVCGACIKWAGIEMVKKLDKIRKKNKYKFEIIGIGGVLTPKDYFDYRKAGANLVQSATGAMWNPYLAEEIKKEMKEL